MPSTLKGRAAAQLRLALLSDCGCLKTLAELEQEARRSGLTGAEIDVAREGRSFEARTTAVLAYACAVKSGNGQLITAAMHRAALIGISDSELAGVASEVKVILVGTGR